MRRCVLTARQAEFGVICARTHRNDRPPIDHLTKTTNSHELPCRPARFLTLVLQVR